MRTLRTAIRFHIRPPREKKKTTCVSLVLIICHFALTYCLPAKPAVHHCDNDNHHHNNIINNNNDNNWKLRMWIFKQLGGCFSHIAHENPKGTRVGEV